MTFVLSLSDSELEHKDVHYMNIINCLNRPIITHFTKLENVPLILHDFCITLEGTEIENIVKQTPDDCSPEKLRTMREYWAFMKPLYKKIGRYVWLTEENHAHCSNVSTYGFTFYADEIGAMPWPEMRKRAIAKKGKQARRYIDVLEETAFDAGDNVEKWWVCSEAVKLDNWLHKKDIWTQYINVSELVTRCKHAA
ncbi:hypothetical protein [Novosphingobium arvoryzae]|jgi:hypothetical protein|uniref:Uncharacterized protein n=1 Tax=Novosphingobium arvoryzae TaxID=1256514 RepID=A0A918RAT7_9SPHN|nr:hypothetical protein [Novosphingobium arvoryzae]GGZ90223.1 hypothetical protein GCM10011617_06400 [Novosphingobium arvoryzae]